MRTASEKLAIIRLVEESELSVRRTLDEIKISRTNFYTKNALVPCFIGEIN